MRLDVDKHKRGRSLLSAISGLGLSLALVACGQEPSFTDGSIVGSENSTNPLGNGSTDIDPIDPEGEEIEPGSGGGGSSGGGGPTPSPQPDDRFPPDLKPDDKKDAQACLVKWGSASELNRLDKIPVKKIYASISVGATQSALNDTQITQDPVLVLIYAAVSFRSTVEYNLLNPKAGYCIVTSVNLGSDLTVNLKQGAQLADNSQVDISIGDGTGDNIASGAGININSDVRVNIID